jgi:transposase
MAIGGKGRLFNDTVKGALASANLYSLVETSKANGVEPHAYLTHLFTQLPYAKTVEGFEALLPWNLKGTLPRTRLHQIEQGNHAVA